MHLSIQTKNQEVEEKIKALWKIGVSCTDFVNFAIANTSVEDFYKEIFYREIENEDLQNV